MRSLLGLLDFRVETFASAEDLLARGRLEPPACVVTEVHLPGISGIELQARLKERGVDLPVIVLAARSDVAMAVRALRAGAVDFIEKPFVDRILTRRIQQAIEAQDHHSG